MTLRATLGVFCSLTAGAVLSLACSDDPEPPGATDDGGTAGDAGPPVTSLALKLEPATATIAPGAEVTITVKLDKAGTGQLEALDLPPLVTAAPVDIEGKTEAALKLTASPDAPQTKATARVQLKANASVSAALDVRVRGKPGDLDLPFGLVGYATAPLSPNAEDGYAVALQKDGRILVAGASDSKAATDPERWIVVRFDADGRPDNTFGKGGYVALDDCHGEARGIAVQGDGKIVVVGWVNEGTLQRGVLTRLEANGTVDAKFGNGGVVTLFVEPAVNSKLFGVAVRAGEKILAGGLRQAAGATDLFYALVSPTGVVDTTGIAGVAVEYTKASLALDGEGFALAGTAPTVKTKDFAIARFGKDSALMPSFGAGGKLVADAFGGQDILHGIAAIEGGLLAVGEVERAAGGEKDFGSLRVNGTGPEPAWGKGGAKVTEIGNATADSAEAVAVQKDGRVLLLGQSTRTGDTLGNMAIGRLGTDGAFDQAFIGQTGAKGRVLYNPGVLRGVALQGDGRIVAAGTLSAKQPRQLGVIRVWH